MYRARTQEAQEEDKRTNNNFIIEKSEHGQTSEESLGGQGSMDVGVC